MKQFLLSILLILSANYLLADCTTNGTGGGTWSDASTWICDPESAPPGCVSMITISSSDSVYIASTIDLTSCGPINVVIYGKLGFKTGRKLKLADGSILELKFGGSMSPGGGGGSSNYLEIGGNQVWTAAEGTKSGPLSYGSSGILPIKLVSFEANTNEDRVELRWITSVEINNDFFTIQKSTDGKNWQDVSIVYGAGNSNQVLSYFEVDYHPYDGVSYYRLMQTDYNGAFSYSNIVPVKFEKNEDKELFNLFPSLVERGEKVNIVFEEILNQEVLVVLRDIKGSEFFSKVLLSVDNNELVAIPIDYSLPKGVYLVTASSENQIYSQKILVK